VIVPGDSARSELARRLIEPDEDRRMPLMDEPLPEPERALIRRWIDAGAPRGLAARAPGPSPEGSSVASAVGSTTARSRPALDVIVPTTLSLAPGTWNSTRGGPVALALPVGPLPAVTALAFRGDDRLLAVGTYGEIVLWDLTDGNPVTVLEGVPGAVHALVFSRDGRRLALGAGLPARSGVVRVVSVPDGTLIHDFAGHDDVVVALALRPDGGQLASASFDQTVRLWDLGSGQPAGVFRGHSDFVYAVAYTPDGRAILSAGKDRTIKRINIRTLKEERTYSGHDQEVLALAIHPDGSRFVSAGEEPQIRWWSLVADEPVARRGGHSGPVHQLAFSGDGRRLISAGADRTVRLWDTSGKDTIRQLSGPSEWQYAVAISGDGRLAAAGGWDGLVRLWEAESGKLRAVLLQPPGDRSRSRAENHRAGRSAESEAVPAHRESGAPGPWFACCPSGAVAGSIDLIKKAQWRAGGVALAGDAARAALVRPDLVARTIRGEQAGAPTISPRKSESSR
jgi:hypothetical protein